LAERLLWLLSQSDLAGAEIVAADCRVDFPTYCDIDTVHFVDVGAADSEATLLRVRALHADAPIFLLAETASSSWDQLAREQAVSGFFLADELTPPLLVRAIGLALSAARSATALRRRADALQDFFDRSHDCLFRVAVDPGGGFRYIDINAAGLKHLGRSLDEVRGHTPVEMMGADAGGVVTRALAEAVQTRSPYSCAVQLDSASGFDAYDATYVPILAGDCVAEVLGQAKNVSDAFLLEAELTRAKKLQAMGQLTAEFVHDFRNVVASLEGVFNLMPMQTDPHQFSKILDEGRRTLARALRLTNQMLTFTRYETSQVELVDVHDCLTDIAPLLSRSLNMKGTMTLALDADAPNALCDAQELGVAVLNLVINARDAMPDGGDIKVRTYRQTRLAADQDAFDGDFLVVAVEDNGSGIAPENLERVFEPFFTTKGSANGTGLGLSTVKLMARRWGGDVIVTSRVGLGTQVSLLLPAGERHAH
jgi:signal transduction histidine kinase